MTEEQIEGRKERKLVIPGEIIVSAEDHLPGDFTRNENGSIIEAVPTPSISPFPIINKEGGLIKEFDIPLPLLVV